jgi:hypothetical protein
MKSMRLAPDEVRKVYGGANHWQSDREHEKAVVKSMGVRTVL